MPRARWHLGGAFRFDRSLLMYLGYTKTSLPGVFQLDAAGAPPCAWTINWYRPRPLMNFRTFTQSLEQYARLGSGVTLEFDSPVIRDDSLEDGAANRLLQEHYRRDRIRRNSVSVANDKLAAHIRRIFPKLPLYAHLNRAAAEPGKRTAAFYNALAEQYDMVSLHPVDCAKPQLLDQLKEPGRFIATINDTCLRHCPCRRDHLMLLSRIRQRPYSLELLAARNRYVKMAGCEDIYSQVLHQQQSCILSENEMKNLYARGVIHFRIQDATLRNEMSVLWSYIRGIFGNQPDIDNRIACFASSFMAEFGRPRQQLPSGLRQFEFGGYD